MIISNLSHLETVTETPNVTGGSFNVYVNVTKKTANVWQYSSAKASAEAFYGDATAIAYSSNSSVIYQ